MSPVIGGSKAFWTDFIKTYESLPVLWNVKSEIYKNRQLKDEAYEILVLKLKTIEPNANREIVRRKINSLRCSYRRELNKIKESCQNAVVPDVNGFYRTSLWYFDLMNFLSDHENLMGEEVIFKTEQMDTKLSNQQAPLRVPSPVSSEADSIIAASISSVVEPTASSTPGASHSEVVQTPPAFKKIKLTREVPYTEGYLEDSSPFAVKTSQIKKSPPRKPRTINPPQQPKPNPRVHYQEEGQHICTSCPCIAAQENEYDKIGKAWASELKLMTAEQQIFAKRAIAEIIFEGQLGGLTRNSVLQRRVCDGDPIVEDAEYVQYEKTELI